MFRRIIFGLLAFGAVLSGQVRINNRMGLNNGTENLPYSDQLYAGGGTAPYSFELTSGSALPMGLNLSSSGLISGTPTVAGAKPFSFSITVTDAVSQTAMSTFQIQLCPGGWGFTGASSGPITLPMGTVGQLYSPLDSAQFGVQGNCTAMVQTAYYTLVSGAMPAGLRLPYNGLTAGLYGTPTIAGTYNFTLQALEAVPNGRIATQQFTVTIQPEATLAITTASLTGLLGSDFKKAVTASGGYIPYSWTASGNMPPGLTLTTGGSLEGQPTQDGTFMFSVTVTDGQGNTATNNLQVSISEPASPKITTSATLPAAVVGQTYSKQLGVAGIQGNQPTWSIESGTLPMGLQIDSSTGVISGTVAATTQPSFTFTVLATAGEVGQAMQVATIFVFQTALTIEPITISLDGILEAPLSFFNGQSPICCAKADLLSGTLPPGMTAANFMGPTPLVDGSPNAPSEVPTNYSAVIRLETATGEITTTTVAIQANAPAPMAPQNVPGGILPDMVLGADYSNPFTLIPAGDTYLPNTFTVTGGALPPGVLLLSYNVNDEVFLPYAVLIGTPTATGTFTFTVTATDPLGGTASGQYTITVVPFLNTPLTLTPAMLPNGTAGVAYSQQLTATNGGGPYTYSVTLGNLPFGLMLDQATGLISGTPTSSGTFGFVIEVVDNSNPEDGGPFTATNNYAITISPAAPLTLSPTSLPPATMGANYSVQVSAAGGIPPYSFFATGLPPGLGLNSGNIITGMCTGQSPNGVTLTVFDQDDNEASVGPVQLGCNPAPLITNASPLPAGSVNVAYSATFLTNAIYSPPGAAPYTWALSNSNLPTSFSLNPASGVLTGATANPGTYLFTVNFTDAWSATTAKPFSLTIGSPLSIMTTSPLPAATTGVAYSDTFMATGGAGGYKWAAQGLPTWLTLSSAGVLAGTPPSGSTSVSFSVTVTDSLQATATGSFVLPINSGTELPLAFTTTSPLPPATTSINYGTTFAATGGSGSYTFSATGLPSWLTLLPSGVVSGVPPAPGPVTFSVTVMDGSTSVTQLFTLPVNSLLAIVTPSPLSPATLGLATTYTLMATGGTGQYTWSAICLPSGLTLDPSGSLSTAGTVPAAGTYTFAVTVTDTGGNTASKLFVLQVDAALTIVTPSPLPGATTGTPYTFTFTGAGGSGVYIWSATDLPAGFTFNQGVLTGSSSSAGPISFTVTLFDYETENEVQQTFVLPVNSVLTIGTTSPLPAATTGELYTTTFAASGGSGSYTWTAAGLPSWLTLAPSGFLTGTPPAGATAPTFTVTVTDSSNATASLSVTLPVNPALQNIIPLVSVNGPPVDLPAATVGIPYSALFCLSGSTGLTTWSVSPALPSWLTLPPGPSSTDTLSGTPPAPGSITFTVTATDTTEMTTSETFTLPIETTLAITNSPTPATVSVPYTFQFTASGGSGTYTWSGSGLPTWLALSTTGELTGTPPVTGPVMFTVTVTDSMGAVVSSPFTLQVNGAVQITTTSPLPAATIGFPYTLQFAATGGTGSYSWSGSGLPAWLTLSTTGVLTGTPPAGTGSISFTVTVTDTASSQTSGVFVLPVNPSSPVLTIITTSPLPAATVGSLYSLQFLASGGTGTYTWTASGQPAWLTLSSAGALTGTPPAGTSAVTFMVTVTDSASNHVSGSFTLPVNPAITTLTITTTSPLTAATVGTLYTLQFTASGGMAPYTWTASGLPAWLTLSSGGVLTGTPPAGTGQVSFTATVTDEASNHSSGSFTLPVNPASTTLTITTTSPLTAATVGTPYSLQFLASGGTGTETWTASGLPGFLTLSNSGLLSGTPTQAVAYLFTVTVKDSASHTASMSFTLPVKAAQGLAITSLSPLPNAAVGVAYSFTFSATGGTGSYLWTGAKLPSGLALSTAGVLSGTPLTPSISGFTFTVTVTDSSQTMVSKTFSIFIAARGSPLQFTSVNLPACTAGVFCSTSIGVTGGTPPYTFSLGQTQPIGDNLTLSPEGVVSGTPSLPETVSFPVQVTDSAHTTIAQSFSIQVNGSSALVVTTTSLPAGTVNSPYSATLTASGGNAAYNWTISSGSLPPGLTLNAASGAITGTPTSAGTSTFSVEVSSGMPISAPVSLTITINSAEPLTITSPLQLPPGDLGAVYSQNLTAIGGSGGYTWTVTAGNLPAGLSLGTTGAISGTPTMAQTASFTATVTDSSGKTASGQFSLTVINPAVPTILTSSPLPDGVVSVAYNYPISVSGGTPPYTWSIAQGTIPDGLTFNSATGTLSGTPTTAGAFTFTLTVSDSSTSNSAVTKTYTVNILAITGFHISSTSPLPNGTLNTAYTDSLAASGGTAPYTWQLLNGSWPPGISLDAAGNLSGTPTSAGTYPAVVQATDSTGLVATAAFSLTIANPLVPAVSIDPAPGAGLVNTPYTHTLTASGGTPPYTWSVISGTLPPGLSLDPTTGVISGTPTQKGNFTFTVQVTDANGRQSTQQFTITVQDNDLTITTAALPNASVNVPYSYALAVTGGSAPYTWSLSAGSLIAGFSIDPASGVLSGTPAQTGTLHFTISVSDQNFDQTSQSFDLTVVGTMVMITTTETMQTTTVGSTYSFTFMAAQGNTPYTWSIVKGTLPPGLSLNAQTGTVSGTATTPGTYTFTVQAADTTGGVAQVQVTLVVKPAAFTISTASPLPAGTAGTAYSETLHSMGGTGAVTWTVGSGTPPGLSLASSTGVLSGTPTMAGDFSFSVTATDSTGAKASQSYQLHIGAPATLVATASGLPATVNPGDQPAVMLTLANGYPLPITLTATLQLSPGAGGTTDLLFSNGSTTMQFTIPANTTQYSFSFQAGTVAGSIQLGLTFQAAGVDITPSPAPALSTQIVAAAPSIKSVVVTQTGSGIQLVIDGLSTTRDMKTATFQFTPASGATLQTSSVTVDVSAMFSAWYQSAASLPLGSQFSLTVPFTIGGNVNTIASVSVTLTNSVGASAPVSATVP